MRAGGSTEKGGIRREASLVEVLGAELESLVRLLLDIHG